MIIVKLGGGLGNQMFQYAFAKYLSLKYDAVLKMDLQHLTSRKKIKKSFVYRNYDLDIFNLSPLIAGENEVNSFKRLPLHLPDKIFNTLIGFKKGYIKEPHFHFSNESFASPDNIYLDGYWQSEKYFASISKHLKLNDFSFKHPINAKSNELMFEINNSNSICLNVRRGDFVTNSFHGTCSPDYYKQAEQIIEGQVNSPRFYIFSDEIEWCKENIKLKNPAKYIGHEYAGPKFQDYLRLMSACKHFIIPNSTFAWWAVWFSDNEKKVVIAPKKWFGDSKINTKDLTSPDWILI